MGELLLTSTLHLVAKLVLPWLVQHLDHLLLGHVLLEHLLHVVYLLSLAWFLLHHGTYDLVGLHVLALVHSILLLLHHHLLVLVVLQLCLFGLRQADGWVLDH